MKLVQWIMVGTTGLLLFSTTVCGLWLRFSGEPVVQSSVNFHVAVALTTVAVTSATLVMALSAAR